MSQKLTAGLDGYEAEQHGDDSNALIMPARSKKQAKKKPSQPVPVPETRAEKRLRKSKERKLAKLEASCILNRCCDISMEFIRNPVKCLHSINMLNAMIYAGRKAKESTPQADFGGIAKA